LRFFSYPCFSSRCRAAPLSFSQTTQPYLFASTKNGTTSGLVTLLRDSTTGVLTMVPNTTVSFKDACGPTTIDPTGNFLYPITITITAAAAGSSKALQLNPISLTLIVN
jgi:hypothetical protein